MASLLAEARSRAKSSTPIAGRIRPGTKVPTKASQNNPRVMAMYQEVLAGRTTFKDAEKTLEKELNIRFPFTPKNPQDFRISPLDIEGGQLVVDRFMELYGTDEVVNGVQVRKLYRFPVVFPDVPGGVEGFFKSEFAVPVGQFRYHSVYSDEGVRNCLYLKPVNPDDHKQAKRKKWLRREPTVRGVCNPANCEEFASGACRFRGDLQFYVPGISGVAPFSMPTGSQYAAEDIYLRLEEIYNQCRGQIPRFDAYGNPVFFITKALKSRSYFDENGVEKHGKQWVPVLETSIDMTKVYQIADQRRQVVSLPSAAPNVALPAAWLPNGIQTQSEYVPMAVGHQDESSTELKAEQSNVVSEPVQNSAPNNSAMSVDDALEAIGVLADQLNIEDDLASYMDCKYGSDWTEGETPLKVCSDLQLMYERLGQALPTYIKLLLGIYGSEVNPELAIKYLRMMLGNLRTEETLLKAQKIFNELIDQGVSIAVQHMQQQLEKDTST